MTTTTMDQLVAEWWTRKNLADQLREKERVERIQALLNEPYVFPTSKSRRTKIASPITTPENEDMDDLNVIVAEIPTKTVASNKKIILGRCSTVTVRSKDDTHCPQPIVNRPPVALPLDSAGQSWVKGLHSYKSKSSFSSHVRRVYGDCDYSDQHIFQRYVEIHGIPACCKHMTHNILLTGSQLVAAC